MTKANIKQNSPNGLFYVIYPNRLKQPPKCCRSIKEAEHHAAKFNNKTQPLNERSKQT